MARSDRIDAKALMNGISPPNARPTATSTMHGSAMPMLKKRSGKRSAKKDENVDPEVSASSATMLGFTWPYSAKRAAVTFSDRKSAHHEHLPSSVTA